MPVNGIERDKMVLLLWLASLRSVKCDRWCIRQSILFVERLLFQMCRWTVRIVFAFSSLHASCLILVYTIIRLEAVVLTSVWSMSQNYYVQHTNWKNKWRSLTSSKIGTNPCSLPMAICPVHRRRKTLMMKARTFEHVSMNWKKNYIAYDLDWRSHRHRRILNRWPYTFWC